MWFFGNAIPLLMSLAYVSLSDISDLLSRSPALELAVELPGDETGQKRNQDNKDPGQDGSKTRWIQDKMESRTRWIQDKMDPGQNGTMT